MIEEASIIIQGVEIPIKNERLPIEKLKYLVKNPRVRSALFSGEAASSTDENDLQKTVHDRMINEPSVKNLIPKIRKQGGLLEPIFVRIDNMEVIEGNSRLRAYRHLHKHDKENPERWLTIPCQVVSSLTDEQQYAYLHQIHVEGKTPWVAYEKANLAYTMWNDDKMDKPNIARILTIRISEVEKRIKVIECMKKNGDTVLSNFSYYDVLVRNRAIAAEIEVNPALKKTLLKTIKEVGESSEHTAEFKSQELRDKLPKIIKKKKELKKFVEGKSTFTEAYENARISGPTQNIKIAIEKVSNITKIELSEQSNIEINTLEIEIKRLTKSTQRLCRMLEQVKKE